MHKTFLMMFRILLIFGIPAAIAFFIGRWIDTRFDIRPYGSLAALAIALISSWAAVIRMYLRMNRELRQIDEEEHTQREEKQKAMRAQHTDQPEKNA